MENKLLFGIILLAGFILAVSAASLYAQSHILEGSACECDFPIELLIPLLSSGGLLVGSLIYYFMSEYINPKKTDLSPVLSLLPFEQKLVIEVLIKNGGSAPQSQLVSQTPLNKVKVSRVISELGAKGVIQKTRKGITNEVKLSKEICGILN